MRKLLLDLDALTVESFETAVPQGRGTVIGADVAAVAVVSDACSQIDGCPSAFNCSVNGSCMDQICTGGDTQAQSCAGTCNGCSGPYC